MTITVRKNTHAEALKLAYELLAQYANGLKSSLEARAIHSNPTRLYCTALGKPHGRINVSGELSIEFMEDRNRPYRAGENDPQLYPKVTINTYDRHMHPADALALAPILMALGAAGQLLLSHFESAPLSADL
jgi:hypothetical protein